MAHTRPFHALVILVATAVTFVCSGHVAPPKPETPEARLQRFLRKDTQKIKREIEQLQRTPREMWRQ